MQKDLFGGSSTLAPSTYSAETPQKDFLQKQFSLRLDHALISGVLLIVAYIFVFSFGVESGKHYAAAEIRAERAMREHMARELGEKIFSNPQALQTNLPPALAQAHFAPVSAVKSEPVKMESEKKVLPAAEKTTVKGSLAPVNPSGRGKFAVQIVTFTSKIIAEQQIQLLLKKGYRGKIVPQGRFLQVCLTGYETRVQALQALEQLKSQGLAPKDAYIRTLA